MVASSVSRALRAPSALTVFTTILVLGETSRTAVAAESGLTPGAVTKAVGPLLAAGLLEEHGPATAQGVGRPRSRLRVAGERTHFLGVKLTAEEAIGVVMDLAGTVLGTHRLPLRNHRVPDVVATVSELSTTLRTAHGLPPDAVTGLGVALSGDIDRSSARVVFSPFLGWRDVGLVGLVEEQTGIATTIENDVRALTFSEQWFGAGVGAGSLALVTIGEGVGCGVLVDGHVLTGRRAITGELGHVPLADPALECYCGAHGCVEAAASTPAILRGCATLVGHPVASLTAARALAAEDDRVAELFRTAGRVLGRGIAVVVNLVGPERVLVSGEGLEAFDLLADGLHSAFTEHAYMAAAETPIVARPLGFEEWARGAAVAALQDFLVGGSAE